jgi:NADPH2:quinone reductase
MKVIRYHEKGGPDVMKVEEMPDPQPGEGQVLLKIDAVAIGYADVLRRSGGYYPVPTTLPHIPGGQVVGTVEKLGAGVDASLLGKQFMGNVSGAYAEYGVASAAALRPLPKGVGAVDALAILSEAETAGSVLKISGRLQAGESVFVPAATGGIGFLAVQLARLWGAGRVIGGASTEEKRAIVAKLGAIPIDYMKEGWPADVIAANDGQGVDLALEVTGGKTVYETLEATRSGGRIVNYGNVSDTDAPVNPRVLLRRNLSLIGYYRGNAATDGLWVEERKAMNREINDFIVSGKLKALIGGTFKLAEAPDAHRALEGRETAGKVVLLPNG